MDELEELNQLISHPEGLQYVDQSLELEVYYGGKGNSKGKSKVYALALA